MRRIIREYGGYSVVFKEMSEEQKKDADFILSLLDKNGQCPSHVLWHVSPTLLTDYNFLNKIDKMQDGTSWANVYNTLIDI